MKQRITALFLALLLLAALSLSGCSQRPQESADGRLRVVCSLFPPGISVRLRVNVVTEGWSVPFSSI